MNTVKLLPKTAVGFKAIRAIDARVISQWIVSEEREEVSWSSALGPWLHVRPDVSNGDQHARWVHRWHDKDFEVQQ